MEGAVFLCVPCSLLQFNNPEQSLQLVEKGQSASRDMKVKVKVKDMSFTTTSLATYFEQLSQSVQERWESG